MVVKGELFAWLNRLASKEGKMREARIHGLHPHIADDHIRGTLQGRKEERFVTSNYNTVGIELQANLRQGFSE